MELSSFQITTGLIIGVILIIVFFINKKMTQNHEIRRIKLLGKQTHKQILAQAKYKKSEKRTLKGIINDLENYIKMLFTFF